MIKRMVNIKPVKTDFTCVILAGGKSLRMGRDKSQLIYHGKPLIRYAADLALKFTGRILVSANRSVEGIPEAATVRDILSLKAPLTGIHAGLMSSGTPWTLVLTCDMPNVTVEIIELLAGFLGGPGIRLILPVYGGFIEPLCGFYHKALIPLIEANVAAGKYRPLDLPAVVPSKLVPVNTISSFDPAFHFKNVNTPSDLEE